MKPNSYNITDAEKETIRELYKNGMTIKQLTVAFKVSKTRIKKILDEVIKYETNNI